MPNKDKERALHMKLERAVNALILSARQTLKRGRPWPKTSTVPDAKLMRCAEIMNQLARPQRAWRNGAVLTPRRRR